MKKTLCFCYLLIVAFSVCGQNVTIRPSGITPALSGTYPRLSYDAIMALPNPSKGDIAYDITFDCLRVYTGGKWLCTHQDIENYVPNITPVFRVGSSGSDDLYGMAVAPNGDIYMAAYFSSPGSIDTISVTPINEIALFVVKLNKNGKVYWVQRINTNPAVVQINHIALDANENVYIAGSYSGAVTFGNTTTLYTAGLTDVFLVKYTKNGAFSWVRRGGGTSFDVGKKIAFDASNNVYLLGEFVGTATFGDINIVSLSGSSDIFIAKYNIKGDLEWIVRGGGNNTERAGGIAVDNNNNVYICGSFAGTTYFGGNNRVSNGVYDIFVARFNTAGASWNWLNSSGGTSDDHASELLIDSQGGLYVSGYFTGTAELAGNNKVSRGSSDIFLLKYFDSSGFPWVKTAGGPSADTPIGIALGPDGDVYLAGHFYDTIEMNGQLKGAVGANDVWIARYSQYGPFVWLKTLGGRNSDRAAGLGFDSSGNLYLAGTFFYTIPIGKGSLNSVGLSDIFVARLDY